MVLSAVDLGHSLLTVFGDFTRLIAVYQSATFMKLFKDKSLIKKSSFFISTDKFMTDTI